MITAGSKMAKSNVMGLVMTSYKTYPATLTGSLSFMVHSHFLSQLCQRICFILLSVMAVNLFLNFVPHSYFSYLFSFLLTYTKWFEPGGNMCRNGKFD